MTIDVQYHEQWQAMHDRFSRETDKLGCGIDTGILDTVIVLNLLKIPTVMSCEGHLSSASGAPWVDIEDPEAKQQTDHIGLLFKEAQTAYAQGQPSQELFHRAHEARIEALAKHLALRERLLTYLTAFYKQRQVPYDVRLVLQAKSAGRTRLESQGATLQEVASPEHRQAKLYEYQAEMHEFTAFLKQVYLQEDVCEIGRKGY